MPQLNATFNALLKEAQFTKELLGAGATEIRRANYATKGLYFRSFTSLATGLERVGKLCLMEIEGDRPRLFRLLRKKERWSVPYYFVAGAQQAVPANAPRFAGPSLDVVRSS